MSIGNWRMVYDQDNVSRKNLWWEAIPAAALPAPVPGIAQQVFPGRYGVFLYYARIPGGVPQPGRERPLLRFESVDYRAEVRLNGILLGVHEGAETPFEFDLTGILPTSGEALLAVRAVTPEGREHPQLDDLDFLELPLRHRNVPFHPGLMLNTTGITGEVHFEWCPAIRIADCHVVADCETGVIEAEVEILNASTQTGEVELEVASSLGSGDSDRRSVAKRLRVRPGRRRVKVRLAYSEFKRWELEDPQLYGVTIRIAAGKSVDQRTIRTGFRDFRIGNGFFRLNGKRILLRSTHTGNHFPIGWTVPVDRDFLRRDLVHAKSAGFNMVRFIAGMPLPEQLDLCDELGLMVYEENLAAWWFCKQPHLPGCGRRFRAALEGMIRRDRNHPSVTIWGLLNENMSPIIFRCAVDCLGLLRRLDPARLVLLASGRWDCDPAIGSVSNPGSDRWEHVWGIEAPDAKGSMDARDLNPNGGAYFSQAGDVHIYMQIPHGEAEKHRIRDLGGTRPVFLSEYGVGSLFNVVSSARSFESRHADPALTDYALCLSQERQLRDDWRRWGFDGVYPTVGEFLTDSARRSARERRRGFDLVRGNPWLCGWNITGMLDHGMTGEGFWDFWRVWKPEHADVLNNGWAPLRWCLDIAPYHAFAGAPVEFEAILANEDILAPGHYRATLRVTGAGRVWWSRTVDFELPAAGPMGEPPLAVPVFREAIPANWPEGKYVFSAELEHGGDARDATLTFHVSAAPPRRKPTSSGPFYRLGAFGIEPEAPELTERPADGKPAVIAVGTLPDAEAEDFWWEQLVGGIRRGDVVIFFDPAIFLGHRPEVRYGRYCSLGEDGTEKLPQMVFSPAAGPDHPADAEFWGAMRFRLSELPPGDYRLRCVFTELFHRQPGARVFDLAVNGEKRLEQFDVFAIAGARTRIARDFPVTPDAAGTIEVTTTSQATLSELTLYDASGDRIIRDTPEMHRGCRRFPLEGVVSDLYTFNDTLYHKDCVLRPHPVFAGLPAAGIADLDYFGTLPGHTVWCGDRAPDETMAAGIATGYFIDGGYKAGVMLGTFPLGAGWFYLNTMHFDPANPAALRLFANLLDDAARKLSQNRS